MNKVHASGDVPKVYARCLLVWFSGVYAKTAKLERHQPATRKLAPAPRPGLKVPAVPLPNTPQYMDCLRRPTAPVSSFEDFYIQSQARSHTTATLEMRGTRLRQQAPVEIHEDPQHSEEDEDDTVMDESRDPLEESGCTQDDSEDDDVDESVLQDIEQFQRSFKDIGKKYRLINRIGEGEHAYAHMSSSFPVLTCCFEALSPPCTRQKILTTTSIETIGISTRGSASSGSRPRVKVRGQSPLRRNKEDLCHEQPYSHPERARAALRSEGLRFGLPTHHCLSTPGPSSCYTAVLPAPRLQRVLSRLYGERDATVLQESLHGTKGSPPRRNHSPRYQANKLPLQPCPSTRRSR
jgi:hypothetical protein